MCGRAVAALEENQVIPGSVCEGECRVVRESWVGRQMEEVGSKYKCLKVGRLDLLWFAVCCEPKTRYRAERCQN